MAKIAVIPGDGIGKEVVNEGVKVLEYLNSTYELGLGFKEFDLGAARYLKYGELVS